MTITESINTALRKYATFSGRATRSEYWWFYLTTFVVYLISIKLGNVEVGHGTTINILGVVLLALIVPTLAVTWRRLHDIGRSGTDYFFILIPIVGPILLIVWLATATRAEGDRFGSPAPEPSAHHPGNPPLGYPVSPLLRGE